MQGRGRQLFDEGSAYNLADLPEQLAWGGRFWEESMGACRHSPVGEGWFILAAEHDNGHAPLLVPKVAD